jgi:hypothetical protein
MVFSLGSLGGVEAVRVNSMLLPSAPVLPLQPAGSGTARRMTAAVEGSQLQPDL